MSGLLEGHLAVVTGGGSGIGRAVAKGYAGAGAQIVAIDTNLEAAAETASDILKAGGEAWSFRLDVTEADTCRAVAEQIEAKIGTVSILANVAGINRRNHVTSDRETVAGDWAAILDVNLNGVFNMAHGFLDQLRRSQGRIVNIGSIQSFVHTSNSVAYTASKHGVLGLTRSLAAELGADGVRVNAIGPGFVLTPMNEAARETNPDMMGNFLRHTPLGRAAEAEDIVGPAIFLASDMSAYVTGTILMVDGGYLTV